jgi:hypothetical protein
MRKIVIIKPELRKGYVEIVGLGHSERQRRISEKRPFTSFRVTDSSAFKSVLA